MPLGNIASLSAEARGKEANNGERVSWSGEITPRTGRGAGGGLGRALGSLALYGLALRKAFLLTTCTECSLGGSVLHADLETHAGGGARGSRGEALGRSWNRQGRASQSWTQSVGRRVGDTEVKETGAKEQRHKAMPPLTVLWFCIVARKSENIQS